MEGEEAEWSALRAIKDSVSKVAKKTVNGVEATVLEEMATVDKKLDGIHTRVGAMEETLNKVIEHKLRLDSGTTCSIARVRLSVGTRLRHEAKGVCTLTEVAANGNWVVQFEAEGNTHTYKPNSQHVFKVELGQAKPADVAVEDGYHAGERVVHSKHGLGVVMRRLPDGRLSVAFDDGQHHLYKPASVAQKMTRAPADAPQQPRRGLLGSRGVVFEVNLNASVREVFAQNSAAILGNDALGQHAQLAVMQGGVNVLSDSWSSLQFNYDTRRRLAVVSLIAEGEDGADRATLTFQTSRADRICSALLHGGAGVVGNYRAEHDRGLNWLLGDPATRSLAFCEFFVQSSHNTFILGQQLKLALLGNPIDIVYAEAFPIALNLGYRCLEMDVFRAHEKAGGLLLVRHGPIGAPSNSVTLNSVISAIVDWMARDERGAEARLRLPLVLSVENNLAGEAAEAELAASFDSAFGQRIVRPAAFHDPSMREVASAQRRVIIKSGSYRGRELGAVQWAELVAMWKPPMHPLDSDATVCKSIEAPSASALANPSRIVAQGNLFLTTTAKKSRRASAKLERSLTRNLSSLLELPGVDVAMTSLERSIPKKRFASMPSLASLRPKLEALVRFRRASLNPTATRFAEEPPRAKKGPDTQPGRAAAVSVSVPVAASVEQGVDASFIHMNAAVTLQSAKRRVLKAAVTLQAGFRGRMAREDARLMRLGTMAIQSGRSDVALALELQMRVINGRRKTNTRRAEARHAIDPTLRVDRIICKVYPPKTYQLSENFDPMGGFDARAQFICMNMQGKAASGRAKLTADVRRGLVAASPNKCRRDRARSVERLFLRDGYDGYMRMDAWCISLRHDFERFLAAEAKGESLPLWMRRTLVGGRKSASKV